MELLADLTPAQKTAVCHQDGPLLVLAGAGSGKTRVVTRRIAWLTEQGVKPWRILAITFTNKAAEEMRERVHELAGSEGAWVSTFHSFAARQLRRFAERLGMPSSFTIVDRADQLALVKEAIIEVNLEPKQWKPRAILEEIGRAKGQMLDCEAYSEQATGYAEDRIAAIYRAYEELLQQRGCLDFSDLLVKLVRLMQTDEEVLQRLQQRFRYLMVDEYQDTNPVQYKLARLLAAHHQNFHATGDPDQSIYRWRGADVQNILDFENDFPGAQVVKLEQNFRSTRQILAAAQGVISHNTQRREKTLWTENPHGAPVRVSTYVDDFDEARGVARRCAELRRQGTPLGEVAVFCRMNSLSLPLEKAFFEKAIPYKVVGAVAFYQRKEVKDVLAYLRVLENPQDDLSLMRVINVPPRRIGRSSVAKLLSLAKREKLSLFELLTSYEGLEIGRATRAALRFGAMLARLRDLPRDFLLPLVRTLLEETGFVGYLEGQADLQAEERVNNVGALVDAIAEFDERATPLDVSPEDPDGPIEAPVPSSPLQRFLEEVALLAEADDVEQKDERVSVMTLHASKGLEFDHVFMVAFEQGILPHSRSADSDDELEEERRLCYVGFTRARKSLELSYARWRARWGRNDMAVPSPFLNEIPSSCFEHSKRAAPLIQTPEVGPEAVDQGCFSVGERVFHDVFGEGLVMGISGLGARARIEVQFDIVGKKTLFQQYAKLVPCE